MFNYVLITYSKEKINKSACYHFSSPKDDLELNPYGNDVPFTVGSNQTIYKLEDTPYVPEKTERLGVTSS